MFLSFLLVECEFPHFDVHISPIDDELLSLDQFIQFHTCRQSQLSKFHNLLVNGIIVSHI